MKKVILVILLVLPGTLGIGVSSYWAYFDNIALNKADEYFQELVQQGASDRELFITAHRTNTHRLNVAIEGVWLGLGFILVGMGLLGINLDRN